MFSVNQVQFFLITKKAFKKEALILKKKVFFGEESFVIQQTRAIEHCQRNLQNQMPTNQ